MTERPIIEQLPRQAPFEAAEVKHYWDYLHEPNAREVMDRLLTCYVESLVYQGVVENIASEQAARMVAMKAASDNADCLIDQLNLQYNKARQASISQDLSEIVGGTPTL